jgi:hypothetical protein
MSSTLQDLVNRAVFYSTEVQTHFGALIADAEWEVDFSSDPHLTFTSTEGAVLRTRPHLLGSESGREKTWLWGWENVNDFPDAVVGLSHEVRKFGAAEDVSELTTPELSLDEELALRLTLASKEATDKWAHYPAAAGAGTTVWLLVDAAEIALPAPQVKVSVRALMQGLTQTTVTDHRAAIEAYVAKRGIPTAELPEGGLRMLFADGSADLSFDDQRRISNCDLNAPLDGEAAEQYAAAEPTGTPPPRRPPPHVRPIRRPLPLRRRLPHHLRRPPRHRRLLRQRKLRPRRPCRTRSRQPNRPRRPRLGTTKLQSLRRRLRTPHADSTSRKTSGRSQMGLSNPPRRRLRSRKSRARRPSRRRRVCSPSCSDADAPLSCWIPEGCSGPADRRGPT